MLYWQNSVRNILNKKMEQDISKYYDYNFFVLKSGSGKSMEASGINVFSTMKLNGIRMERNPENVIRLVNLICSKQK